jgi:hypothetical protein
MISYALGGFIMLKIIGITMILALILLWDFFRTQNTKKFLQERMTMKSMKRFPITTTVKVQRGLTISLGMI